ncbi:MAG: hypothetical protein AAF721_36990, partial [Myxococcota bacterium]
LLLVGAAAEKGATRIDVRIDTDDMEMRFDGDPFTREDVEELYVSMFGDRTDRSHRARQDLAVALNAAMALNPRWIKLRSAPEGGDGVEVTLRPGKDETIRDVADLEPGTLVHVKERFRPGLLLKFVDSIRGRIPEELVLREACRFSARPIMLGEERIGEGMTLGDVWGETRKSTEHAEVVAAFEPIGLPARLIVLVHGVELATHPLDGYPQGFVAMADCAQLRRDVSAGDVVRDEAYGALLSVVQRASDDALTQLLTDVGYQLAGVEYEPDASHDDDDDDDDHDDEDEGDEDDEDEDDDTLPAPEAEPGALARIDTAGGIRPWVGRMLLGQLETFARREVIKRDDELRKMLRAARLWTTISGEHVDTERVDQADKRVAFTTKLVDHFDPEHANTVYAPTRRARGTLRRIFGKRVVDRTRGLLREAEQHANRQRWRARPRKPELGDGVYYARVPIVSDTPGVVGEVGLRRGGSESCTITVVVDGCLLLEVQPKIDVPGFVAIVEAPLTPNAHFNGLRRSPTLGAVLADILVALRTAMVRAAEGVDWTLASGADRGLFCAYIWQLETRQLASALFAAFGFKRRSIDHHLRSHGGPDRRPRWEPDWQFRSDAPHPLATLPLFPRLGQADPVSLDQVAREKEARGAISFVGHKVQQVEPPRLVLAIGPTRTALLAAVFGNDALQDCAKEHRDWLDRAQHRKKKVHPFVLAREVVGPVHTFETEHGRGLLGLSWPSPAGPERADASLLIEVRIESRFVQDISERCPMPGLVVLIDDDSIQVNRAYSRVEPRPERDRLVGAVMRAAATALASRIPATQAEVRPGEAGDVQWMLAAALPGPAWHRALRLLIDVKGPEKGQLAYLELLALRNRWPTSAILKSLLRRLRKRALNVAALRRTLEDDAEALPDGRVVPDAGLRIGLAQQLPQLRSLAVFRKVDGGAASLDDLWAYRDEGNKLLWLAPVDHPGGHGAVDTGGALVVVVDEIERRALEIIFGRSALEGADAWLAELAKRRAFESRPALETLALSDADVWLKVDVKRRGFEGQIGLPRCDPAEASPSVLACRDRRVLGTVAPRLEVPVMAVLSSGSIGDEAGSPLDGADLDRLGQICESYQTDLVRELALALPSVTGEARGQAAAWVRWMMVHRGAPLGRAGVQSLSALDSLEVFATADGRRVSLDTLKAAHGKYRRLRAVFSGVGTAEASNGEPVLDLRGRGAHAEIEALFGQVENHHDLAERARLIQQRRSQAPPVPTPPKDALAVIEVKGGGIRGQLWIDPPALDASWLHLVDDDLVVERRGVPDHDALRYMLRCGGVVSGSACRANEAFTAVDLGARAIRTLERGSVSLYDDLARTYSGRLASEATPAQDVVEGRSPMSMLRRPLASAVLQLARAREAGQGSGPARKLLARLKRLPLLELASGRIISLAVALEERPRELWHLGLWDEEQAAAAEPEPSPAEAAAAALALLEEAAAQRGRAGDDAPDPVDEAGTASAGGQPTAPPAPARVEPPPEPPPPPKP